MAKKNKSEEAIVSDADKIIEVKPEDVYTEQPKGKKGRKHKVEQAEIEKPKGEVIEVEVKEKSEKNSGEPKAEPTAKATDPYADKNDKKNTKAEKAKTDKKPKSGLALCIVFILLTNLAWFLVGKYIILNKYESTISEYSTTVTELQNTLKTLQSNYDALDKKADELEETVKTLNKTTEDLNKQLIQLNKAAAQ